MGLRFTFSFQFSLRFAAIHHHSHDTCMTPRLCAEPKHLRLLKNGRPTKPGGTRTANSGGQNCAVVTRDMAGRGVPPPTPPKHPNPPPGAPHRDPAPPLTKRRRLIVSRRCVG